MQHIGPISGIAAFGNVHIATAGYDNQVILWDPLSGRSIGRVLHDHLANQCVFSKSGKYLLSAGSDYTARLWTVDPLRISSIFVGHDDDVEMVAIDDSERLVATCSRDRTIRIFEASGQPIRVLRGHGADVISIAWQEGGAALVSSSDDGTIRRWDVSTGEQLEVMDLEGVETDTVVLGRDGTVFAGDDNGEISVFRKGNLQRTKAHDAGIKRLLLSSDGGILASLSYDRRVVLWDVSREGRLEKRAESGLPAIVWPRSAAFAGEGSLVFGTFGTKYARYDYSADKWDISGIEADRSLNAIAVVGEDTYTIGDAGVLYRNGEAERSLGSLCNFLLPAEGNLLTGGQIGQVIEAKSGRVVYQHRSPLNCGCVFYRNGELRAIVGAYTGEGLVFRFDNGAPTLETIVELHSNAVKGVAASAGRIFSVCATSAAAMHDAEDYGLIRREINAHDRIANGCAPLGMKQFVSVSRDLKLRLWGDGATESFESPHKNSIKCVAASPQGDYVATGDYAGTIALFNVAKRSWISVERPTAAGISCIVFDGARRRFLASSYDGNIYPLSYHT